LIRLLDEEGNRSRAIAEVEAQTDACVDIRALAAEEAQTSGEIGVQQAKILADTNADQRKDRLLRHVSWRFTITTVAPVIFAMLVTVFMFLFWKWKQPDAANAFEKVLVMVITGGLGWAAGRSQSAGSGRLEDRMAHPRKTGLSEPESRAQGRLTETR
jgi:hypothetical protein